MKLPRFPSQDWCYFGISIGTWLVCKAAEDCRQAGLAFIPLAADTFGGWHAVANEQVTRLAAAHSRQTGQPEDEVVRALRQQLSLLLMKGNSALLIGRVPEPPEEDLALPGD